MDLTDAEKRQPDPASAVRIVVVMLVADSLCMLPAWLCAWLGAPMPLVVTGLFLLAVLAFFVSWPIARTLYPLSMERDRR